jgi:hypothetical protein
MGKSDKPGKSGRPASTRGKPVKTGRKGSAELSEDDLKRVSGGIIVVCDNKPPGAKA